MPAYEGKALTGGWDLDFLVDVSNDALL